MFDKKCLKMNVEYAEKQVQKVFFEEISFTYLHKKRG